MFMQLAPDFSDDVRMQDFSNHYLQYTLSLQAHVHLPPNEISNW